MEEIKVNTPRTPVTAEFEEKIRPAQRSYLLDLISKKVVKDSEQGKLDTIMKCLRISEDPEEYGMSKKKASELITWFLRQPDKPAEAARVHAGTALSGEAKPADLKDGYYALKNVEGHKNEITFYRLRTPKQGNWTHMQFIDQVVGHGKRYPVRGDARAKIQNLIREQGAVQAQQLYGQEIGACGRCGRELTDDTSRRFGIGPDCRQILGI